MPAASPPAPQDRRTPPAGPLRVLHVVQPTEGGVARVVADLVASGPSEGLHSMVACPVDGELADAVRERGGELRHWAATRSPGPGLAAEVRQLAGLLAEARPDVVHAHSAKAGLAARLALRGRVPTVFQPHAWSFEAVDGATARLARRWERYAARWAARIVCVSAAERHTGQAAGIKAAWSVIPNGVDTARFSPTPVPAWKRGGASADRNGDLNGALSAVPPFPPPTEAAPGLLPRAPHDALQDALPDPLRVAPLDALQDVLQDTRQHALPDAPIPHRTADGTGRHAPLVVCMARLCHQKGQDVLLHAWPQVTRQVPSARLVLVGDGPAAATLRRTAPASVTFAGPTTDPVAWYRAADLVVLPSRWEGMALAPLEALACGTAVLVTDVDGARESLPPGQQASCVVPPRDPGALAAAAVTLLRDAPLRAALGRTGRRHVRTAHDVRRSAAAIAAVYRALGSRGGAAHTDRKGSTGPGYAAQATHPEHRESVAT